MSLALVCGGCWQPPDLEALTAPSPAWLVSARPYVVRLPTVDGGVADAGVDGWPLLVVLHGYGSTGSATQRYLGLFADEVVSRYAVILPYGELSSNIPAWHPAAAAAPPWDSAYIRAVIADALATQPLDPRRVFVVGYSQGAEMAHRVACDGADLVSAVVSVVGQLIECAPSRPVSALEVHGTADSTLQYVTVGSDPGAVDTISAWGRGDGCTGPLDEVGVSLDLTTQPGPETTLSAFRGCPAGIDVQLATMSGAPHSPVWTPELRRTITGFLEAHARH